MQMCGSDRMNQLAFEIIKEMTIEEKYVNIFVINLWVIFETIEHSPA